MDRAWRQGGRLAPFLMAVPPYVLMIKTAYAYGRAEMFDNPAEVCYARFIQKVIDLLESGETDTEVVQEKLDEAVLAINDLQEEFYENESEIETVARDCIGVTVDYILKWFDIPIDMEEAIRERDW